MLLEDGNIAQALSSLRAVLRARPDHVDALVQTSWLLATVAQEGLRSGAEAVVMSERACSLTGTNDLEALDALAAAYAETSQYTQAVTIAISAAMMDAAMGNTNSSRARWLRVEQYQNEKPWRVGSDGSHGASVPP
jgi:hypothetical protein